jgi:hypothetical protein
LSKFLSTDFVSKSVETFAQSFDDQHDDCVLYVPLWACLSFATDAIVDRSHERFFVLFLHSLSSFTDIYRDVYLDNF